MLYERSMKWSVAILAFTFTQWAWLNVRCINALHAKRCIFIIDAIDDVDESLKPYFSQKEIMIFEENFTGFFSIYLTTIVANGLKI